MTWAQRSSSSDAEKNFVYLTISVPDVPTKDMKLDLKADSIDFTGHSDSKKATYHVAFDFFAEIDPDQSNVHHSARDVELKLRKKELKEEYWPRLLKDTKKMHYLKTNFDKVCTGSDVVLRHTSRLTGSSGLMRTSKKARQMTT